MEDGKWKIRGLDVEKIYLRYHAYPGRVSCLFGKIKLHLQPTLPVSMDIFSISCCFIDF